MVHSVTTTTDADVIARRIAVVDMLRGVTLMLLTLGCVLLWFHRTARFSADQEQFMIGLTHGMAEAGAFGLILVMGMSLFFFRKYHFSAEKYSLMLVSFLIFGLYQLLFAPSLVVPGAGFAWLVWTFIFLSLLTAGWVTGAVFQHTLLLDADDYARYMERKHDFRKVLLVFGQSPLFFFVFMLVLVEILAWTMAFSAGFRWPNIDFSRGYRGLPARFGYGLPRIYLTCFCVLALLYPLCRTYNQFKTLHPRGWLTYL